MDEKFIEEKSKLVLRTLQILCLYPDYKMDEISHNFNKCPKCKNIINEYDVPNPPRSHMDSWGDSSMWFDCNGILFWSIKCNNCNEEIHVGTEYNYNMQKGCLVRKFDFFMDEHGYHGHHY